MAGVNTAEAGVLSVNNAALSFPSALHSHLSAHARSAHEFSRRGGESVDDISPRRHVSGVSRASVCVCVSADDSTTHCRHAGKLQLHYPDNLPLSRSRSLSLSLAQTHT